MNLRPIPVCHPCKSSPKAFSSRWIAWLRLAALVCCVAAWLAPAHAQNTAPTAAYRIVVCLRFAENPRLTPRLAEAVAREVRDQLTHYFGALAEIEVHHQQHWLLDAIGQQPLDAPAMAVELLAGKRDDARFFLFSIDYGREGYLIEDRQIDGLMRQMSPVYARTTPDRLWLGKAISLAVKESFALVATVGPHPVEPSKVRLMFHGPRDQLSRAIRPDGVLLPLWVVRQRDGGHAWMPIPNTILRIDAQQARLLDQHDGVTVAHVQSNLANPWQRTARVLGFQAIQLRTHTGRIRVRVLDEKTGAPAVNCIVYANDRGFEFRDDQIVGSPDARGWVEPTREFRDVAYLRIVQGSTELKLPVPLTRAVNDVRLEIAVDPESGEKNRLRRELGYLVQDLQTLDAVLNDRVGEVNAANAAKRYEEALQAVAATLAVVRAQREAAAGNLAALRQLAAGLNLDAQPLLAVCDHKLSAIAARESSLAEVQADLKDAIDKRNAKSRADARLKIAADAELTGDGDETLRRYRAALSELSDDPGLQRKVAALEEAWRIKGPEHQAARDLVYRDWANAEVTQLEAQLPGVLRAFETLKANRDHLSGLKLSAVNGQHLGDLTSLVEQLHGRNDAADRQEFDRYAALVQRLAEFQQQVTAYLQTATAGDVPAASPPRTAPTATASPATPGRPVRPSTVEEEEEPPRR